MNGMDHGPEMEDELLSAWLDRELSDDQRAVVRAALDAEPVHRATLAELERTRALVRDLPMREPPAGFLASLLEEPITPVAQLDDARGRRRDRQPDPRADRQGARRVTAAVAGIAAAAAVLIAVLAPGVSRVQPALATDVRVHQAGVAASGDPVSGLAPLAHPLRFGR